MMMAEGQYTVFAPTDDAFAALLTNLNVTKEELLGDKEMLTSVLTYHVVPMVVKAADIPYGTAIDTANGQTISISDANVITDASGNTANIVGTDMMATNGVVHVIDTVLLPKYGLIIRTNLTLKWQKPSYKAGLFYVCSLMKNLSQSHCIVKIF